MCRRPPRSTRTDTPFPYTTLFRSARTFAVGADVAGDVAHAPVAVAPLVVQRCAGFREALQPDLLGATVDRVPELVAELQHVAQLAAGAEVEVGADRQEIGRAHV